MSAEDSNDRVSGWLLAGVLFIHLLLLRDASFLVLASYLLLGVGALLRGQQIFAPAWLERTLFFGGVLAVFFLRQGSSPPFVIGELGGIAGAAFLLRPVTPQRGLRVVFCVLLVLIASALRQYPAVGPLFIVLDVVVLIIITQQIHRPPEAARSFWSSLIRSLRIVIPVSVVVILVFWLFPDYSFQPPRALTGFAGNDVLNPGIVADLSQSRRVAFVATFSKTQDLPDADQLYWRGKILERSEGMRWTADPSRKAAPRSMAFVPAAPGVPSWSYSQDVTAYRGGTIAVLDRAQTVNAFRGGQDVAVMDSGGLVLSAVGAGSLRLEVTAAADTVADPPERKVAKGARQIPHELLEDEQLKKVVEGFPTGQGTAEVLAALAHYLEEGQFAYTLRPPQVRSVSIFFLKVRRGFCEHYAASTATLLRLAGVPSRVVVGYRGGEWNPWLRTITVRDSDAHAWVEAWDPASSSWLRFDPTNYVAPYLTDRMERELDSDSWPWYKLAQAAVVAFFTSIGDRIAQFFEAAGSLEIWDSLRPAFFVGLLLSLTAWLVRRIVLRRMKASQDLAASLLADLESRAARAGQPRCAGETPLHWLSRLRSGADEAESENLRQFAEAYDSGVYSASGLTSAIKSELRSSARSLRRLWKKRRREAVKIAS